MNALRKLHAALVPDGLVIDTQPVSPLPPVEAEGAPLVRIDMREWAQTIALLDREFDRTIRDGAFVLDEERRFMLIDGYDDGAELVAEVSEWRGTRLEGDVAERLSRVRQPVRLHQEIRLRVLRAR